MGDKGAFIFVFLMIGIMYAIVISAGTARVAPSAAVHASFGSYVALGRICACETRGLARTSPAHTDREGRVIIGTRAAVGKDVGICQINTYYHGEAARRLGLDLYKREDNIAFAKHLYDKNGARPWRESADCHGYR